MRSPLRHLDLQVCTSTHKIGFSKKAIILVEYDLRLKNATVRQRTSSRCSSLTCCPSARMTGPSWLVLIVPERKRAPSKSMGASRRVMTRGVAVIWQRALFCDERIPAGVGEAGAPGGLWKGRPVPWSSWRSKASLKESRSSMALMTALFSQTSKITVRSVFADPHEKPQPRLNHSNL